MSKLPIAIFLALCLFPNARLAAQENDSADQPAVQDDDSQQGQGRGFRGRGGGRFGEQMLGYVPLLQIDSVKKELKVEGDQATQVESLTIQIREDFAGEIRDVMESLRDAAPEDRQQFRAKMAEIAAKVNERLSTVLNTEQTSRLRQINLQLGLRRNGAAVALTSADIATALDLTPEQQEELGEQAREARRQRGREAKSLEEARQEANELLTPEQQEKLTNLLGEEFDLPAAMLERGRGRGGFGGRRGGEGRRGLRQRPEAVEENASSGAIWQPFGRLPQLVHLGIIEGYSPGQTRREIAYSCLSLIPPDAEHGFGQHPPKTRAGGRRWLGADFCGARQWRPS